MFLDLHRVFAGVHVEAVTAPALPRHHQQLLLGTGSLDRLVGPLATDQPTREASMENVAEFAFQPRQSPSNTIDCARDDSDQVSSSSPF